MFIKYRNLMHVEGLVGRRLTKDAIWNDAKQRAGMKYRITISGVLQVPNTTPDADALASLLRQRDELEQVYAQDGGDFYLLGNDGVTVIEVLKSSDTVDGVRVVGGPSYEEPGGIEWVRQLTFTVTLEADIYEVVEGVGGVGGTLSFSEVVSFTGNGGGKSVIFEPVEGGCIEVGVTSASVCYATQSGSSTSRGSRPNAPPPLYPDRLINESKSVENVTLQDGTFEVRWNYQFKSVAPFGR